MKIPEKIRIDTVDYTVEVAPETIVLNARQCKGMVDYEYHNIQIDNSLQDEQGTLQTLWHEIFHAIINERDIDIEDEEDLVDKLALGIIQLIRDNPGLFNIK